MMKVKLLFCLLCFFILGFLSSCSPGIKTQTETYSTEIYLDGDSSKGVFSVEMSVELPIRYKNKKVLNAVKNNLITLLFGEEFIEIPYESILELFAIELGIDYLSNNTAMIRKLSANLPNYKFDSNFSYKGETLRCNKNIYSYCLTQHSFDGGAYELSNRFLFNFSLLDGSLIAEKDVFVDGFESNLAEIIKNRLFEEYEELIENNLDESEFWTDEIFPNGNFYLNQESIDYAFDPSEIAPHYIGDIYISLPIEKIKHLLKDNTLTKIYLQ